MDMQEFQQTNKITRNFIQWKTRKLAYILSIASPGDTIVSPELSRYGRNLIDVLDFISTARSEKITISAIKDNLTIRPDGDAASDLMLHVLAAAAQFERARLSERVKEGLDRAKMNGKKLGGYRRKGVKLCDLTSEDKKEPYRYGGASCHPKKADIKRAVKAGGTIAGTARAYNVSRQTIYRWLKEPS